METRIDDSEVLRKNQELTYDQARIAYEQQDYELAAVVINQLMQNSPDDPNAHLLKGHIYYMLQQYDVAKDGYKSVLHLTDDQEIINLVHHCLATIQQYTQPFGDYEPPSNSLVTTEESLDVGMIAKHSAEIGNLNGSINSCEEYEPVLDPLEHNPFADHPDGTEFDSNSWDGAMTDDPFGLSTEYLSADPISDQLELPPFWQEEISVGDNYADSNNNLGNGSSVISDDAQSYSPFAETKLSVDDDPENQPKLFLVGEDIDDLMDEHFADLNTSLKDPYLEIDEQAVNNNIRNNWQDSRENDLSRSGQDSLVNEISGEIAPVSGGQLNQHQPVSGSFTNNSSSPQRELNSNSSSAKSNFDDDSFDLDAFESAFGAENEADFGTETFVSIKNTSNISSGDSNKNNIEFLNDFDEFDDLGDIPGFELTEDGSFDDGGMLSESLDSRGSSLNQFVDDSFDDSSAALRYQKGDSYQDISRRDEELFTITGTQESVPVFTQLDVAKTEPIVALEQGILAPFENAPLDQKQWWIAGTVGLVSVVGVALVSALAIAISPAQQRESVRNTGLLMALVAGATGATTAGFMGNLTLKQIRRTTKDLQSQFDSVRQGNLNVEATVYSQDELGYLATGFNDMARVVFTTTNEAQRKAIEMEEAKENLQRQVIRLLDDVEGAARGDLTVQAEVTADVLGAVADAFNLTIQNLRDIVQQVKVAARDVTKGSTNSETFARALSGDALRQAEELAVTLNSVQVMTDSIQRVAEAAKEAETVAREASKIAQKGGEAVENTVAGILEIRETVAETTRKVKRLAESSQEINSIVAIVSQIASRTNLLALNASIEAARAGEAGRGFAIVADEVRQLADRSAKSLKEIEQIVMQIQSETSSVMTAMEEGTQQVIHQTKLAEEAKRSLDNIIQVADHIDILVRSITSDTVEQTETSRAVAQVMQSVELTAQETSQEAQRVSGALQHLVGVSRDLIASVERFRVETIESR
ncbi:MAG: HAMP domain-containing protein [Dolichospermum sp. DET50]|nr:HAMP domain-containing protein [Dolichospermum sp. DET66]MBS3031390.1 HAMP domain-containing protein [Dolichospermum sp. DET67]MBS3036601.1 HAMP domain-containing protein [Dolichospermum sp. DET50]QSX68643.1 MAG: HAMP domain-containing protein [Dolichospermum sp. DET69]